MMKIERLTEVIELPYWTCCNEDHRHRSRITAENCVKRSKSGNGRKRWPESELLKFAELKRECGNASAMARRLGMSASNFSRLARKGERIKRRQEDVR